MLSKENLIQILEDKNYDDFISLHPNIWKCKDLLLDEGNIFSIDDTKLSEEQINTIHLYTQPWSFVLVYTNRFGEKQVFFNYHNGSNGSDGDAVKSMYDAYKKISSIKKDKHVKWTTLLEYRADHCDDVYSWFITFILK